MIFSFICMFCRSLFVLLYFFFWPLSCLVFFDIRILITPLVSSNSSYTREENKWQNRERYKYSGEKEVCLDYQMILDFYVVTYLYTYLAAKRVAITFKLPCLLKICSVMDSVHLSFITIHYNWKKNQSYSTLNMNISRH
jgi:hypothetical protein